MTTTVMKPERGLTTSVITGLKAADQATREDRCYQVVPASEGTAALALLNPEVHQLESMSTARLLLNLVTNVAIALYLAARSLDNWLSGPPTTARERERLSISAADRHWWYWARL